MAEDFDLLRARIVIEATQVREASKLIDGLQSQIKALSAPVKLNVEANIGGNQGRATNEWAEQLRNIQLEMLRIERASISATRKVQRLGRLRREALAPIQEGQLNEQQQLQFERQAKAIRNLRNRIAREQLANDVKTAKIQEGLARGVARTQIEEARRVERARQQSVNRVLDAVKRSQIQTTGVDIKAPKRLELLARQEAILTRLLQRRNLTMRETIRIERELASIRLQRQKIEIDSDDAVTAERRMRSLLRAASNLSSGVANAPGVPRFIGQLGVLAAQLFRAAAQLVGMTASVASLVVGVGAIAVVTIAASVAIFRLGQAAYRAAAAIGRTGLQLAISGLRSSLALLLAPVRAAYQELTRLFSIQGLRSFAAQSLETAAAFEQVRAQLRLGFGAGADAEFARLRGEADLFGVSLLSLSRQFARFTLATRDAGVTIQTVRNLFTGLQAAGRVFGLRDEELEGIFFALEQISSKGKLTSEELIRQIGNRLPGAFKLAADALKQTPAELVESLRRGEVSAQQFFEAFSAETIRRFYTTALTLTDQLSARMARLRNVADLVNDAIGQGLSGTVIFGLERVVQAAIRVSGAFSFLQPVFTRVSRAIQESLRSMNFESLFTRLAAITQRLVRPMTELLSRFARLSIVANGLVLGAAFGALEVAIDAANRALDRLLLGIQRFTGIDLSTAERAFAAVAAFIDILPLTMARVVRITILLQTTLNNLFGSLFDNIKRLVRIWATVELIRNPARAIVFMTALKQIADVIRDMKDSAQQSAKGITGALADELQGFFRDMERAQDQINRLLGEEGKRKAAQGPAAELNNAADNLRSALSTPAGEVIDVREAARRVVSAGVTVGNNGEAREQQVAANTARTAVATEQIARVLSGNQGTPFVGRGLGALV